MQTKPAGKGREISKVKKKEGRKKWEKLKK